jgi:hypothetical protein
MDSLRKELSELEDRGHFDKTIDHVQEAIDLLLKAKEKIINGEYTPMPFVCYMKLTATLDPSSAAITLTGLKKPVKDSFDHVTGELKDYYSAQGRYSKAVDKVRGSSPFGKANHF